MFQNLFIIIAFGGHYGSSDLTKPHTMTPSAAIKPYYILAKITYLECRTFQMRLREDTADFKFLSDNKSTV
jgi:hypothetical protein